MNFLSLLLRKIWRALFFVNGVLTFVIMFPLFYLLLMKEKWFPKVFALKKFWAKLIIYNVGIRYSIIDKNKNGFPQTCVICPNHSSFLDIVMTYIVCPKYFHFMGKAELKKVPLFNKFFENMNILVDRGSIMGSHRAFTRASQDIDKGISIAIFPEATIPDCSPHLGRVKNGAFKLAIEKQIPIIPVVFLDNWKILPDGVLKKTGGAPGVSRVVIHLPIETIGLSEDDLSDLKNRYNQIMVDTLSEFNCFNEADLLKVKASRK
jgi:1-acyl-sn-glycerol-3-phosphate acyltransferase